MEEKMQGGLGVGAEGNGEGVGDSYGVPDSGAVVVEGTLLTLPVFREELFERWMVRFGARIADELAVSARSLDEEREARIERGRERERVRVPEGWVSLELEPVDGENAERIAAWKGAEGEGFAVWDEGGRCWLQGAVSERVKPERWWRLYVENSFGNGRCPERVQPWIVCMDAWLRALAQPGVAWRQEEWPFGRDRDPRVVARSWLWCARFLSGQAAQGWQDRPEAWEAGRRLPVAAAWRLAERWLSGDVAWPELRCWKGEWRCFSTLPAGAEAVGEVLPESSTVEEWCAGARLMMLDLAGAGRPEHAFAWRGVVGSPDSVHMSGLVAWAREVDAGLLACALRRTVFLAEVDESAGARLGLRVLMAEAAERAEVPGKVEGNRPGVTR